MRDISGSVLIALLFAAVLGLHRTTLATPPRYVTSIEAHLSPQGAIETNRPAFFRFIYNLERHVTPQIAAFRLVPFGPLRLLDTADWSVDFTQVKVCTTLFRIEPQEFDTCGFEVVVSLDGENWKTTRSLLPGSDGFVVFEGDARLIQPPSMIDRYGDSAAGIPAMPLTAAEMHQYKLAQQDRIVMLLLDLRDSTKIEFVKRLGTSFRQSSREGYYLITLRSKDIARLDSLNIHHAQMPDSL